MQMPSIDLWGVWQGSVAGLRRGILPWLPWCFSLGWARGALINTVDEVSVFATGPTAVGFTIVWPEGVIFSSIDLPPRLVPRCISVIRC